MDKIFVRQLAVSAVIGILPHERIAPQPIWIDIEVAVDVGRAAATDHINSTVDYAALTSFLRDYITNTRFQLLETLADDVCTTVMNHFPIPWLRLTITKKPVDMPDVACTGIIIERQSEK